MLQPTTALPKLTKTHREYLSGYVTAMLANAKHRVSYKKDASLNAHGFVGTTLATRITPDGCQWLGYDRLETAVIMMLQARRDALNVRLRKDESMIEIALRYHSEESLWEQRAAVIRETQSA